MTPAEIKELFGKFGASLDRDDVWQVQSAVVIKHKALERLAVAARISFDKPIILRAERDEAVILVHGSMCAADNKNGGETRHEWSIGEALVNVNYKVSGKQAGYVYAMAEKRAKDRVILKLAGLHGLYSEDEADEFKESHSAPQQGRNAAPVSPPSASSRPAGAAPLSEPAKVFIFAADKAQTANDLKEWMDNVAPELDKLPANEIEAVKAHARLVYRRLAEKEAA
jgi:hypothetical protein